MIKSFVQKANKHWGKKIQFIQNIALMSQFILNLKIPLQHIIPAENLQEAVSQAETTSWPLQNQYQSMANVNGALSVSCFTNKQKNNTRKVHVCRLFWPGPSTYIIRELRIQDICLLQNLSQSSEQTLIKLHD